MAQLASDIRGVMIPVTQARVLLPNASVSEVITYGNPQPIEGGPEWIFGVITWRGWRIPLFSFSLLAGQAEQENLAGAKVAIIKALAGEGEMPFMAMLAQGFPRLTAITTENLLLEGDQDERPPGVIYVVNVNDEPAFVPDLDAIENRLMQVLGYREAPDSESELKPAPVPAADSSVLPEEPSEEELAGMVDAPSETDLDSELDDAEGDDAAPAEVDADEDPLAGFLDDEGVTTDSESDDPLSALDEDDDDDLDIDLDFDFDFGDDDDDK